MPNWCNNKLTVSCDKKHTEELRLFKTTASGKGVIKSKDLNKERESWLSVHRQQYEKELRLKEWVEHSITMSVDDFFIKVLNCTKQDSGDMVKGDTDLSMQNILPCPEELRQTTSPVRPENGETQKQFKERVARCNKQYGAEDWHRWSVSNWGTKWNIQAELHKESKCCLEYVFDSAWSPPIAFLEFVSKKFPNLEFELSYSEPGADFQGVANAKNGELSNDTWAYSDSTCDKCQEVYNSEEGHECEMEHE